MARSHEGKGSNMAIPHQNRSQNDLLRWYLLLWVCLVFLWGLVEISSRAVSAAWSACSIGSELPTICTQLKQHLGPQGQPDGATLPPTVLTSLLLQTVITFLLLLLLYGILLWFVLSGRGKRRIAWFALYAQGLLACMMAFFVPAIGFTVPVSLILVLILESCATFKQVRSVLVFSCGVSVLFLLTIVLAWRQGTAFGESSLTLIEVLVFLMIGFLFVGGFFILYTRLAQMHSAIETAYVHLEVASERIEMLTLITERQRMARELHDTLAQGLAGIILQLGVVHARVKKQHYDDDVQLLLEQTLVAARETLANARGAIDHLRLNIPSAGELLKTVQEEMRRFTLTTGIPCDAELNLLSQISSAHVEQVLGVMREALTNVACHAHASRAWVRVSRDGQALILEIGDDGIGFDPASVGKQPGHYGLLGLRERVHLAGGLLTLISKPGQGTRIQYSLPEEEARAFVEKE